MTLVSIERLITGGMCIVVFVLGSTIVGWLALKAYNATRPRIEQDIFLTKCFWVGITILAVVLAFLAVADAVGYFVVGR